MEIRILDEMDANLYQELRLEALKNNPENFSSTFEREVDFTMEMVQERIRPSMDKFVLGAMDKNNSLVGMVTFVRETSTKTSHKANLFGMYVKQSFRNQGIGKSLLLNLIDRTRDSEIEHLNLTVVSTNGAAKKLYESIGFETYGLEKNGLKFNNEYVDEILMKYFIC